jgi:hypothetical protein
LFFGWIYLLVSPSVIDVPEVVAILEINLKSGSSAGPDESAVLVSLVAFL